MPKIAFLILDDVHHVHHLAPIAFELSRREEYECVIFIQAHSRSLIKKLAALYPDHRCRLRILSTSFITQIKYRLRQKRLHSRRIIECHIQKLLRYDAIISADSDMDQLIANSKHSAKKPLFFSTRHGAGDRPMETFDSMKLMDLVFFPGKKYLERFVNVRSDEISKCMVIGYPKFDVVPIHYKPRLFSDDKPVVIYNPHFVPELSSWMRWGVEILEYFLQQKTYNFIFAPHTNLFNRTLKPHDFPKKYCEAKHILVDLGSEKSVDMTYTQAGDIYLGDVSSQVYEFIRTPRPCIFLNAHTVDWRNQSNTLYLFWQMGPVIDQLPDLWEQLRTNPQPFPLSTASMASCLYPAHRQSRLLGMKGNPYVSIQEKLFNETFSVTAESAGLRASKAIHHYLTKGKK